MPPRIWPARDLLIFARSAALAWVTVLRCLTTRLACVVGKASDAARIQLQVLCNPVAFGNAEELLQLLGSFIVVPKQLLQLL